MNTCTPETLACARSDGDVDLVIGTGQPGGVYPWSAPSFYPQRDQLFVNDGTGNFTEVGGKDNPAIGGDTVASGILTYALALADLDGDGDLDLVKVCHLRNNVIMINDGTGTFTAQSAAQSGFGAVADSSVAVVVFDVDGDQDLDIVVGNFPNSVAAGNPPNVNKLYLNDGNAVFTEQTDSLISTVDGLLDDGSQGGYNYPPTTSLCAADIDNDGDVDLIIGTMGRGGYTYLDIVLRNDGSGETACFLSVVPDSSLPPF